MPPRLHVQPGRLAQLALYPRHNPLLRPCPRTQTRPGSPPPTCILTHMTGTLCPPAPTCTSATLAATSAATTRATLLRPPHRLLNALAAPLASCSTCASMAWRGEARETAGRWSGRDGARTVQGVSLGAWAKASCGSTVG